MYSKIKISLAAKNRTYKNLRCLDCGNEFKVKSTSSKRCEVCQKKYRKNYQREKDKERHIRMPDKVRQEKRNQARKRAITLRSIVHQLLGNQCVRCGYNDGRALQVDHINGDGFIDRAKRFSATSYYLYVIKEIENKTKRYQLLCANCNWIKRHENGENARRYV